MSPRLNSILNIFPTLSLQIISKPNSSPNQPTITHIPSCWSSRWKTKWQLTFWFIICWHQNNTLSFDTWYLYGRRIVCAAIMLVLDRVNTNWTPWNMFMLIQCTCTLSFIAYWQIICVYIDKSNHGIGYTDWSIALVGSK